MLKKFLPIFLTLVLAFSLFSVGASALGSDLSPDYIRDGAPRSGFNRVNSDGTISVSSQILNSNKSFACLYPLLEPNKTYTVFYPATIVDSNPSIRYEVRFNGNATNQPTTNGAFSGTSSFPVVRNYYLSTSTEALSTLVNGFTYFTFTTGNSYTPEANLPYSIYFDFRKIDVANSTFIDWEEGDSVGFMPYIVEGTISDATVPVRSVYSSKPVSIPAGYALCLYSEDGHTVEGRLSSSSLGYAGYGDKTFVSGQYAFGSNSYISAGRLSDNSGTGNDIHWYVPDNINSSLFHKVHIGECLIHFSGHDYYYIVNPSAYTDGNVWYSNGSILFTVSPESGFTWAKLIPLRSDSILNEAGQVFELGDFYDLYDDPISGALTPSLGENTSSGILYGDTGTATTVEPNNQYSEITLPNNDNFFNSLTRGITNIVDYLKSFISFFPDLFSFLPSELVSLLVGFFAVVLGVILIKFLL